MNLIIISSFLFLASCCYSTVSFAQNTSPFNTTFYQNSHLELHQINPAAQLDEALTGSIQYQSFPGALSRLKNFEGDFSAWFNENQYAGVQLWSANEGSFIQRNRVYGLYGVRTKVKEDTYVSLGVQMGMVSYRFKASTSSPENADNGFDFGFGTAIKSKNLHAGVSVLQIPEVQIAPLTEIYTLSRVIETFGMYSLDVTSTIKFIPYIRVRLIPELENVYQFSPNFSFLEGIVAVGVNVILDQGVSPHVDVSLPIDDDWNIKVGASYFAPAFINSNSNFSLSKYELFINVFSLK